VIEVEVRAAGGREWEEAYSQGYDCGFRDGFLAGAQDGFAKGYDAAT
jgi:hypothetical protein